MNKRVLEATSKLHSLSPNVAHPFNAILANLNDIKVKTNGRMLGNESNVDDRR